MRFILCAAASGFVVPFAQPAAPTAPQLAGAAATPRYTAQLPLRAFPGASSPPRPPFPLLGGALAGALAGFAAVRLALAAVDGKAAEDEEVLFSFGDAVETADATKEAIAGEEVELTERQKEIARLKAAETFMMKPTGNAKCQTCGYVYKWEEGAPGLPPGKTPFDYVPDSWSCPNCKSPKAFFEAEMYEIAGFADNQAYGFGTNTWTESQKSTAIYGGLGLFFLLFIGGYALN
jgi:rubredoxin